MKIHCFSTGRVRIKRGERGVRRYLSGGWRENTLPVNVFAIEHPEGICLFDTGQTARAATPGYLPRWHPFLRLARFELEAEDEAAAQLRRLGLDPADVRWVVLSHLHTDHVGGLEQFQHAEVLVSREEWRCARGAGGRLRGYLPQYWPPAVRPRLIDLDGIGRPGSRRFVDLSADGRLSLVSTPGHTPGHMSLLVRADERCYLLGGDAANSAAELSQAVPPLWALCAEERATFLATHDEQAGELLTSSGQRALVGEAG